MERVLNLAGKNSSEIFQLRYPYSLLTFCDYDLSYFAENAIAVCDEALRSGSLDIERATDLRNSLKNMHVWIEHNLRTVYDKIVIDCWIDYICRRDNVGTTALWNRFIDCKSAFEKAVFVRLCEYRYNKGINEWLNLVRVQDYAKNKVYFLFSREISGVDEANARRNYFDLMFSVTARELGCRLEDLGVTQVFSAGRVPSAPFMYPNISKDIIKNLLPDFDYSDDYSDIGSYESLSDQIAMDAFSHMKAGLNQELSSYNMSRSAMEHTPMKIYMPCGLKAVVDLEIDALIESGGWLARCKRCGRYFVKDAEHTEEYCSLPVPNGMTCLEVYEMEHPKSRVTPEAEKLCEQITDEMYSRVSSGAMSLKEYESWKLYLEAMKGKVNNGEIQPEDLTAFINYSRTMDITRSNPVSEVRRKEPEIQQGRVVKPFVPERISRSEVGKPPVKEQPEQAEAPRPQPRREGFFTSPSVDRQRSQGKSVSHIIRGGEPRNAEPQFIPEPPRAVTPEPVKPVQQARQAPPEQTQNVFTSFAGSYEETRRPAPAPVPTAEPVRRPAPAREPEEYSAPKFTAFSAGEPEEALEPVTPQITPSYAEEFSEGEPSPEWESESGEHAEDQPSEPEVSAEEPAPAPRKRVIRKNAAAISAYGKIAGTPLGAPGQGYEAVTRPEPPAEEKPAESNHAEPEKDPFWEIGSIFDVLEQSENDMSKRPSATGAEEQSEPSKHAEAEDSQPAEPEKKPAHSRRKQELPAANAEHSAAAETETPKKRPARKKPEEPIQMEEQIPAGIWTEERHLFEPDESDIAAHEELNMIRDKKRGRSSKTQRLFDAIMRESDDNPNFRKK